MTNATKKTLKCILYVYYWVCFEKNQKKVKALLDLKSEVNRIISIYIVKLGFFIRKKNIRAQKINRLAFEKFEMVIARFQV